MVQPNMDTEDKYEVELADMAAPADLVGTHRHISPYQEMGQWQTIKTFKLASLFCLFIGFNACSDGYQLSVPGSVVAMNGFIDEFGIVYQGVKQIEATTMSAWGAGMSAGQIAILIFGSYPADIFGRKYTLLMVQVLLCIACLVEMFGKSWQVWFLAKFLSGFSVGLNQAVANTYVAELAPTKARGALIAVYQLWFAIGQLASAIGVHVVAFMPENKWRHIIYSEWVFSGIACLLWLFLPESPRWLAMKGKDDQAKAVLRRMNGRIDGYDVDLEFQILQEEIEDGRRLTAQANALSYFAIQVYGRGRVGWKGRRRGGEGTGRGARMDVVDPLAASDSCSPIESQFSVSHVVAFALPS